ncbi:sensor histidine kinase [Bacillus taeanensis]|uniref:Circadian input-output histidine kinase CikA n=1 Tax=Bacillus taeanensis TaxID=273032 RepID=A0A366XQV7_9BACI|nr:HAMP domain-containing sensor histidine kinase [Bacillus taeanensis]RBW67495.1 two-component sensor histidine kinase [Bacillus taeanensis]
MSWNRIEIKLGGSILMLFLVVLLPLGFVIDQIFTGFYYTQAKSEIGHLSTRYANYIHSVEDEEILTMFEQLANLTHTELYIINKNGEILANSGIPGLPKGTSIDQETVEALALNHSLTEEYEDPVSHQRFVVSGKAVFSNISFEGGVFVLSSVAEIDQSIYKIRQLLILSGIGAFFLAVGFTFIVSWKLSQPLVKMENATRKISKGELDTKVNIQSNDEIGFLASAINDLSVELKRYRDNRQEFFANISHELRTPITYLDGYANLLKEGLYQSEEEKQQYVTIIQQESKRLIQLINDLFNLAKMEEGRFELNFEEVNIVEAAENVVSKIVLKATQKNLSLYLEAEDDLPSVYGDGLRIEQVFINLLENSIHYTEQGFIRLRISMKANDTAAIIVEDTGIGIPEEELSQIFERFHRVEKSRSRNHGGSGLGLAIVKKLVELQKGEIRVTSKVGKGTRFEILLPVIKGEIQ